MADNDLDKLLSHLNTQMTNLKDATPQAKGDCAHCHKPIVGPLIEASGRRYHPEHFVCKGCSKSLHGQDYFEPEGGVYCTKCYHSTLPTCAKCGQKVLERAVTLTEINKAWHPEHFTCAECSTPLEGADFYTENGQPYCPTHYHSKFSNSCVSCRKTIQGEIVTTPHGAHYHVGCFVCNGGGCGKKLGGIAYYEHNGKVFCENHYQAVALDKCPCGKPIQGQHVTGLGKKWHVEHFVCAHCNKQLVGLSYAEVESKPYCEACDAKLFP